MPKRDGIEVALWPPGFSLPPSREWHLPWLLFAHYQGLNSKKDLEQERDITFRIGPAEWKKLELWTHRSRQTIKRWQKKLIEAGWITVEPQRDGSELVTLHSEKEK
jgi:hypothetical protein